MRVTGHAIFALTTKIREVNATGVMREDEDIHLSLSCDKGSKDRIENCRGSRSCLGLVSLLLKHSLNIDSK
jgi:hypothetical protein